MRWPNGEVLQEWEGYITEVGDDRFWANLVDITAGSNLADEWIEMPLIRLPERERAFVQPGALFRWRIYKRDGQTFSYVRFSRRRWTRRKIERAGRKAER